MLDESKVDKYLARIVDREGGQSLKFVSPGMAGVPDRIVILPGGVRRRDHAVCPTQVSTERN